MQHSFELAGRRVRLWQNRGESYEHVLMKALGFAMYVHEYPNLEIERKVGLRYKPDLIAISETGGFDFWGECGLNSIRKTSWVLRHANTRRMVLFKLGGPVDQLTAQLRTEIPQKYRIDDRLTLISFYPEVLDLTANHQIATVASDWYKLTVV